eukprot:6461228-Pyramimonas_sp.AAC.1
MGGAGRRLITARYPRGLLAWLVDRRSGPVAPQPACPPSVVCRAAPVEVVFAALNEGCHSVAWVREAAVRVADPDLFRLAPRSLGLSWLLQVASA